MYSIVYMYNAVYYIIIMLYIIITVYNCCVFVLHINIQYNYSIQ